MGFVDGLLRKEVAMQLKRQKKSGPVRVQVHIKIRKPRGVTFTAEFMRKVVEEWAETGKTPAGIEITPVQWSGPGRKTKSTSDEFEIAEVRERLIRRVVRQSVFRAVPKVGKD